MRTRRVWVFSVVLAVALAVVGFVVAGGGSRRPTPVVANDPSSSTVASTSNGGTPPTTPTTTTHPAPAPPYAVEDETISLFDPSRYTPARGSVPAKPGRSLLTIVRRPVGAPGPLPLVVFAHGWNSNPGVYESLLDTWAAAGYLVAAPTFPDSANTLPGTPVSDYPDQARDLSFVITALLGGRAGPVDPARIAVAGHSDGGTDVALLALNPAFADHRIRAYVSLSSEIPVNVAGPWGVPTPGALLVAVGTNDEYGLFPRSEQVFVAADMAKVLLTEAGANHLGAFLADTPAAAAMRTDTVRFLDAAMTGRSASSAQLGAALSPTGDPTITLSTGSG